MTEGCLMTLTQGLISYVKITMHTYQKSLSGPLLLTAKIDRDNISYNCCPWPKGVSWPWPKVTSLRSRSQWTQTKNSCMGHNSSLPSWIYIIYHTIISWPWFRVTSLWSRSQFTDCIFFQTIAFHGLLWWRWYFTQLLSMTQGLLLWRVFVPLGHV